MYSILRAVRAGLFAFKVPGRAYLYFAGCVLVAVLATCERAEAASNAWSLLSTNGTGLTVCNGAQSLGAVKLCVVAQLNLAEPWRKCGSTIIDEGYDDDVPPTFVARINWQRNAGSYIRDSNGTTADCGSPTINTTWSFTDECTSGDVFDPVSGSCDAPPCEALAGLAFGGFFEAASPELVICNDPSEGTSCAARSSNAFCSNGLCYGDYKYTGAVCELEPEPDEWVQAQPNITKNCIQVGAGQHHCIAKSDENCGWVNGEPWCAPEVPSTGCAYLASGGMVCTAAASAPPGPTAPDGVTPATPDASLAVTQDGEAAQSFNFFNASTISSSGTPTSGGETGGGSGDGTTVEVQMPGECEMFAQTLCDIATWLTEDFLLPDDVTVPTEEITAVEYTGADGLGGGACPAGLSFSLGGASTVISYQPLCDYAYLFYALIMFSAAVVSGGILLGVRI